MKSLRYMFDWIVIAAAAAVIGVVIVFSFLFAIDKIQTLIPINGFWIIGIGVLGAAIAGTISRIDPASRGEGIPSYIRGLRDNGGSLSLKTTLVKLASSFATLATWGSGGLVGPLGRVTAGFSSSLVSIFRPESGDRSLKRIGAICGLSAVLASITGAPIGSGIFAVEVIQKRDMRYTDLFPSVLASSLAVLIGKLLPLDIAFQLKEVHAVLEFRHIPALLVTVLLTAIGGRLFELFYGSVSGLMRRDSGGTVELRFGIAAFLAIGFTWAVNPAMLGMGKGFVHTLFDDPSVVMGRFGDGFSPLLATVIILLVRSLAVGLTVGSGQSAGFFAPLSMMGMLIGTAVAYIFGYAGSPGDIHILQAVGLAGLLAGSQNVPLAAAIMVSEIFGPHLGFPAALAAILGFQLNRQHTIYDVTLGEDADGLADGEFNQIIT